MGIVLLCIRVQSYEPFDADRLKQIRDTGKWFGEMMEKTFGTKNDLTTGNLRGTGAFKSAGDFEIARRVGGGKAMDIQSEPQTETEQALLRSRELMARLRALLPTA